MGFIATLHGAKVYLGYTGPLGSWGNILWFSKPDFNLSDLQNLATEVKRWFVDSWVDNLVVGSSLPVVRAYDMRTIDGPIATGVYSDGTGDSQLDPVPLGLALVATLRTAKRGRAYRGRLYASGLSEDQLDVGLWEGATAENLEDMLGLMKSGLNSYGWIWGIHTTQVDGVTIDPQTVTPITSWEVRSLVPGHQRRRNRRP